MGLMAALIDCYEAIPLTTEAQTKRQIADQIRALVSTMNMRDEMNSKYNPDSGIVKVNTAALHKIVSIIKGEVGEADLYKKDFMDELAEGIPLVPTDGKRRRI